MTPLRGQCHCGAVQVSLAATRPPAELPVRICGCTFCRRHGARYTSDPAGTVELRVDGEVGRYRFGLGLADFLFCRRCGSYVGAHEPGAPDRAVININVLDDAAAFVAAPTTMDYDAEDEAARRARRARGWTPARLITAG
jgi:hypothetical protein